MTRGGVKPLEADLLRGPVGRVRIEIPKERIAEFCRMHRNRKLALFGSVLREDFRPESDADVLVEFEPEHVPGFLRLHEIEQQLSGLLEGGSY